ncbi:MAG: diguanylate cyclase domain-containing protein [Desulfovibrionales bacterium]
MNGKILTPQEIESLLSERSGKENEDQKPWVKNLRDKNGFWDLPASDHLVLEQVPTFGKFFEKYKDGILILDRYGAVKQWNKNVSSLFGWTSAELKNCSAADLFADRWEYNVFITRLMECTSLNRRKMHLSTGNEKRLPVAVSGWILKDFPGQILGTVLLLHQDCDFALEISENENIGSCTVDQIAEQWRIEMALKKGDDHFMRLAEKLPVAVYALRDGRFVFANRAAEKIFATHWDALMARPLWELIHPDFEHLVKRQCMALSRGEAASPAYETRLRPASNEKWLQLTAGCGRYRDELVVVGVATDITDRKVAEECNRFLMFHDLVTGLPNWRLVDLHLKQALDRSKRYDRILGLLNLDLKAVKKLQKEQGEAAAEHLLSQVVDRVRKGLRKPDVAGRLGTDHILVILEELKSRQNVLEVADRLAAALNQPYVLNDVPLSLGLNIGLSVFPYDGGDPDMLIRKADTSNCST